MSLHYGWLKVVETVYNVQVASSKYTNINRPKDTAETEKQEAIELDTSLHDARRIYLSSFEPLALHSKRIDGIEWDYPIWFTSGNSIDLSRDGLSESVDDMFASRHEHHQYEFIIDLHSFFDFHFCFRRPPNDPVRNSLFFFVDL